MGSTCERRGSTLSLRLQRPTRRLRLIRIIKTSSRSDTQQRSRRNERAAAPQRACLSVRKQVYSSNFLFTYPLCRTVFFIYIILLRVVPCDVTTLTLLVQPLSLLKLGKPTEAATVESHPDWTPRPGFQNRYYQVYRGL